MLSNWLLRDARCQELAAGSHQIGQGLGVPFLRSAVPPGSDRRLAQITGTLAQLLGREEVGHGPEMAQSCVFDPRDRLARPLLIRVRSQAIQVFK